MQSLQQVWQRLVGAWNAAKAEQAQQLYEATQLFRVKERVVETDEVLLNSLGRTQLQLCTHPLHALDSRPSVASPRPCPASRCCLSQILQGP